MSSATEATEQLDSLCEKLAADIAQRERETAALKARLQKLEAARDIVRQELAGGPDPSILSSEEGEPSPTLKNAVLSYFKDANRPEGVSASEVTNILRDKGEGSHVTPRVFYSMVYLTLMRLVDTKDLRIVKGPRGRLFIPRTKIHSGSTS